MIESLYKAAKEKGCLTLLGMSGVGKTWAGLQLADMGADIYSVDYEIGKFLGTANGKFCNSLLFDGRTTLSNDKEF